MPDLVRRHYNLRLECKTRACRRFEVHAESRMVSIPGCRRLWSKQSALHWLERRWYEHVGAMKAVQSLIPVLEIERYISGVGRERWVLCGEVGRTYLNFRLFNLQSFAIDSTLPLHLSTAFSYSVVTKSPTLVLDCTNSGARAGADLSVAVVVVVVLLVGAMRDRGFR
jgi:hypothetical protein